MKTYTDWTSGEPIEKEWAMTGPTDPALRARDPRVWSCNCGCWDGDMPAAEAAPIDVEERSLAVNALGEAIRHAAMLRTESVTIQAPLARYLLAALRSPDTETAGEAGDGL